MLASSLRWWERCSRCSSCGVFFAPLPAADEPVFCRLCAASRGRGQGVAAASWFEQVYSPVCSHRTALCTWLPTRKLMATASLLPSFRPSLFLSPSTCMRASSPVPPVDPSWASLSWLVGSSDKHTHRKYKCAPVPPCVTRQTVLRAGR